MRGKKSFVKVLSNPAILYMISRYATYIIQFVNSLFIAVYLGPYYLGIWGFINLVLGYIGQLNLGIPHSVNVIIAVKKQNIAFCERIIGNGISMILLLSAITFLFLFMIRLDIISIGSKYQFARYVLPVTIIAVFTHINSLFSNIFRVYGKIAAIAINQSLYPVLVLCLLPFFRGEKLLWVIIMANGVAFVVSFFIYVFRSPVKVRPAFSSKLVSIIQTKGWYLFLYNTSFYLILLTTKSFISKNYTVEEFGFFTFSYSLANVVLLLLNSISFLIFPKMLNRFASSSNEQIHKLLGDVRVAYISTSHLLIHAVILLLPLFLLLFPMYTQASSVFKVTALAIVLYANSFGYQGVLMARGKEKTLAFVAMGALLLNIMFATILVYGLQVTFDFVILSTLLAYLLYVLILAIYGRKVLNLPVNVLAVLKDVYPWRMMLPFALSFGLVAFGVSDIYFIIPFVVYLLLNFKDIVFIKDVVKRVLSNPNFINI